MAVSQGVEHAGDLLTLHPNGFAIMEVVGQPQVADVLPEAAAKGAELGVSARL